MNERFDTLKRHLVWGLALLGGTLLAYGFFLVTNPQLRLLLPALWTIGLLPLGLVALLDHHVKQKFFNLRGQLQAKGQLFEDAYEHVLLKRQVETTSKVLLPASLLFAVATQIAFAGLQQMSGPDWAFPAEASRIPSMAFCIFLAGVHFVLGRTWLGAGRSGEHGTPLTAMGGLSIYASISILLFALQVFSSSALFYFAVPIIGALSVLPALVYPMEWAIRAVLRHYSDNEGGDPAYVPALPQVSWGQKVSTGESLQYQFGADFRGLATKLGREHLAPVVALILIVLWIAPCFVVVPAGHEALITQLGRPIEPLGPGVHFRWPWPFSTSEKMDSSAVHSHMVVGKVAHDTRPHLWNDAERCIDTIILVKAPKDGDWPVELASVNARIEVDITDAAQYRYNHIDPEALVLAEARRLVTHIHLTTPRDILLSTARSDIEETLRKQLQERAQYLELGVDILSFTLPQVHPPADVSDKYEEAIQAKLQRDTAILSARKDSAVLEAAQDFHISTRKVEAGAQAAVLITEAEADLKAVSQLKDLVELDSTYFWQRRRLETLTRATQGTRKVLVLREGGAGIQELNLESDLEPEMLDLELESRKVIRQKRKNRK